MSSQAIAWKGMIRWASRKLVTPPFLRLPASLVVFGLLLPLDFRCGPSVRLFRQFYREVRLTPGPYGGPCNRIRAFTFHAPLNIPLT